MADYRFGYVEAMAIGGVLHARCDLWHAVNLLECDQRNVSTCVSDTVRGVER